MFGKHHFLNSADPTLHWINDDDFDASLISNILFSDKIILNEPYFFNSNQIASHIKRSGESTSLFEAACRAGFIVPAFRDKNQHHLAESEEKFASYYGRDYVVTSTAMKSFVNDIVASVDAGRQYSQAYYWPDHLSQAANYEKVVRRFMQQNIDPSTIGHAFQSSWISTVDWRTNIIEKAAQRTRNKGANGLQRAEIFNELGWLLVVPKTNSTIYLEAIHEKCQDDTQKNLVNDFVKWLAVCKYINEAEISESNINVPGFDFKLDGTLFGTSHVPHVSAKPAGFNIETPFPPISALIGMKSKELIALRSEYAGGYLRSLTEWSRDPSARNEERLKDTLTRYSKAITAQHKEGINTKAFFSFTKGQYQPGFAFLGLSLSTMAGLAGFSTIATSIGAAFAVFNFVSGVRRRQDMLPETRLIELTADRFCVHSTSEDTN